MITITIEPDVTCGECGADYPVDMDRRNYEHYSDCSDYLRVMVYSDAETEYAEYLDDVFEPVSVCGYEYSAGDALRKLDPVAFRQGVLDWADAEGIEFVNHM